MSAPLSERRADVAERRADAAQERADRLEADSVVEMRDLAETIVAGADAIR